MVAEPVIVGDLRLQIGASIGIACYPRDGDDPETLTGAADRAMYAAKSAGRGIWCLASAIEHAPTGSPIAGKPADRRRPS